MSGALWASLGQAPGPRAGSGQQWEVVLARAFHFSASAPQPEAGLALLLGLECLCCRSQVPQEDEGEQKEPRAHGEAGWGPCQPVHCGETA